MPPKNKKDAEEEAKRLQEERLRKQQEEARMEMQRKKYAGETLQSGLFLPASSQLIIDFSTKSLAFVTQKLMHVIKQVYPSLEEAPRLDFIMKELHYYIKDSMQIFGNVKNPDLALPHRIMIACMLSTLLNCDNEGKGTDKVRQKDERHLKDVVIKQCQKAQGKEMLSKSDGLKILKYASQKFFGRYLLITMFDKFSKKEIEKGFELYLETPNIYQNDASTHFVDLSEKPKEEEPKVEPAQE